MREIPRLVLVDRSGSEHDIDADQLYLRLVEAGVMSDPTPSDRTEPIRKIIGIVEELSGVKVGPYTAGVLLRRMKELLDGHFKKKEDSTSSGAITDPTPSGIAPTSNAPNS